MDGEAEANTLSFGVSAVEGVRNGRIESRFCLVLF